MTPLEARNDVAEDTGRGQQSLKEVFILMELQVFSNAEFGSVRSTMIKDEPWFVGKDVAEILGYSRTADAIKAHVDAEDKGVNEMFTPGGKQQIPIINESGLYSLILSSKLLNAKKFKRWVTSEVLPAIRKHGVFVRFHELERFFIFFPRRYQKNRLSKTYIVEGQVKIMQYHHDDPGQKHQSGIRLLKFFDNRLSKTAF